MLLFEDHHSQSTAINHKAVVSALAFSPDGSTLATGAKDGSLLLRDANGHVSPLRERGPKPQPVHAIDFLPSIPRDLAPAEPGFTAASAGDRGLAPAEPGFTAASAGDRGLAPAEPGFTAAPGDSGVIVGGEFGWSSWRLEEGVWREFRTQTNRPITSLAVINERLVAFGIGDRLKATAGTFELWDISADRKLPHNFHEPNGVRAIAACPAKKLVAWVTCHRKVLVWDITSPTKPTAYPQPGACPAVALSANGKSMAVAVDWTTKIYDVEKKRERLVLKGHKGQVHAVAFSPDGQTLMTGSWDQTVRLWDVATGLERANFNWDIGRVYCVTYAPDGLRLAAGGDLGRVVVWDAE